MRRAARSGSRERRAWRLSTILVLAVALLSGCATQPARGPAPVVLEPAGSTPPESETSDVVVQGLEPEVAIDSESIDSESPWDLALRADSAPTDVAIELRLAAIDGFLELQEFGNAETQANYLLDVFLDQSQINRLNFQRGRIALGFGQYQIALQYLQPLRGDPLWTADERAQLFLALAEAQRGLDRRVDALVSLFLRDRLLGDRTQRLENQQRILDLLRGTSELELALLRQSAGNNGLPANLVDGWLAFAQLTALPEPERVAGFLRWRNSYPGHPADQALIGAGSTVSLERFNHVALLLPFTSPFANAAQAFHDGFMDAHAADTSLERPTVSLYDIGETAALAPIYYQSATVEGADFIVGPLGKDAAAALLQGGPPAIPTLVVADVPPESVSPELYGISLSPELEARQVAERGFRDGHRQAAILRSDSPWGGRAAAAFEAAWIAQGGNIVSNKSFPDSIEDYSQIIQRYLEVSQSESRRAALSSQLGINLEFTPRRRDDIDLLFFAGNARQARLLVPQLRFYQAHDLPIYATSNVFNGALNPAVDADLDNLVFGDMHWMVDIRYEVPEPALEREIPADPSTVASDAGPPESTEANPAQEQATEPVAEAPPPEPQPVAKSPYSFTPLDRLYALGLETYHLIPRLSSLRSEEWQRYNGQAFDASVGADGNVMRHLEWATFRKGRIRLLDVPGAPSADAGQ